MCRDKPENCVTPAYFIKSEEMHEKEINKCLDVWPDDIFREWMI